MGCGTSFVKYVLFFFNLLVSLLGIVLIAIGVVFLVNWKVVKDELQSHLTVAPWVFIVIGAVMFTIAFFGCCGAIRESHCMVVTLLQAGIIPATAEYFNVSMANIFGMHYIRCSAYAIFLLVIIIVQVAIAILLFVYGENIKNSIGKSVDALFDKRASASVDKATESLINNLQQQFECCGKNGAIDYGINAVSLPPSCCAPTTFGVSGLCTGLNAYPGCSQVIPKRYEEWNQPIAGVAIGIACVEIVGALFALYLANSIRNMDRRSRY